METKCSKCGGQMITGYLISGARLVGFIPQCDEKKFRRRQAKVLCDTCIDCGFIENIRVEEPEKLK